LDADRGGLSTNEANEAGVTFAYKTPSECIFSYPAKAAIANPPRPIQTDDWTPRIVVKIRRIRAKDYQNMKMKNLLKCVDAARNSMKNVKEDGDSNNNAIAGDAISYRNRSESYGSTQSRNQGILANSPPSEECSYPQCSICLDNFCDTELVTTLPCCHQFHAICLRQWLVRKNSCPFCRSPAVIC